MRGKKIERRFLPHLPRSVKYQHSNHLENFMKKMVGNNLMKVRHIGFTHGLIGQKKKDGLTIDRQLSTG